MFDGVFRQMNGWVQVSPGEFRLILMVSLLFMAGSMAFVWANVKMIKQAYEFQTLKRENQELLQKNRLLKIERESLTSLYRIQALAQKELGLRPAKNNQMVTVFLK